MKENFIGLVPAAGKGVRFRYDYPKEIHPINDRGSFRPIFSFIIENFVSSGIKDIVFVINHTKHKLIELLGNGSKFGCNIFYVVQEDYSGKGSSGGLAQAMDSAYPLIKNKNVVFGMPDTIIKPINVFDRLLENFNDSYDMLMGLMKKPQCSYAVTEFMDNEKMIIKKIIDKNYNSNLDFSWGCLMWNPKFTEFLHNEILKLNFDFADIMNKAIISGLVFKGIHSIESYTDIGIIK